MFIWTIFSVLVEITFIYRMNFFTNINVSDALTVWDGVKESMRQIAATKSRSDPNGLDFSFITPTLLGLFITKSHLL